MTSTRATDLVSVLEDIGVDVHRVTGDEVSARCPVHYRMKGRESTRNSWYMNIDTGLWHCFTCGARGNLPMLLSELCPDPSALWDIQKIVIDQGLRRLSAEESTYDPVVRESVDWGTYFKFLAVPDSVISFRHLDPQIASKFGVRWDPENKATTVPIVSELGELRGWQAKKAGWFRNTPSGVNKDTTLFGIERAFADTALLVESPLDVVRFHSVYEGMDLNCVSAFGSDVSEAQVRMLTRKFDKLIVAMDNDQKGKMETRRLSKALPSFRNGVFYWHYGPDDPKDIGEMTDGQIIKGLANVSRVRVV